MDFPMTCLSLKRTVRLYVPSNPVDLVKSPNTYAGTPMSNKMGAYYEFIVTFSGSQDSATGFVASIYDADRAIRDLLAEKLSIALGAGEDPSSLIWELYSLIETALSPAISSLRWSLNPYYHLEVDSAAMKHVTLIRRYSFSAAHRLQNQALDDQQNMNMYGKCSRPNGHGHNYGLEVRIVVPADSSPPMNASSIDELVMDHVISKLDHQNLNMDVDEFEGVIPTLENITIICHDLLEKPLEQTPGRLERIEVWETDRTSCVYPPVSMEPVS